MKHACVLALAAAMTLAQAAENPPLLPPSEPYVPKAQRIPSREAPAANAELKAQALAKLRQRFDAADSDRNGTLTQQEAGKAGLGYVEQHFQEIDRERKGAVTFAEVTAFLRLRK